MPRDLASRPDWKDIPTFERAEALKDLLERTRSAESTEQLRGCLEEVVELLLSNEQETIGYVPLG